jgi:hypothetical protein
MICIAHVLANFLPYVVKLETILNLLYSPSTRFLCCRLNRHLEDILNGGLEKTGSLCPSGPPGGGGGEGGCIVGILLEMVIERLEFT